MFLIKFIFITVIILWVIRLLFRLIFPVMIKNMFSSVQQQAANASQQQPPSKPEGSISIDHTPKKEKQGNADKLGDFVEYEEIK